LIKYGDDVANTTGRIIPSSSLSKCTNCHWLQHAGCKTLLQWVCPSSGTAVYQYMPMLHMARGHAYAVRSSWCLRGGGENYI